jgi:mRNA-degrading endonuclease RelE of RelBE toxin-antitoxin system
LAYVIKFTDEALLDVKALPKNVKNSLKKELKEKLMADPAAHSYALRGPLEEFRSFHYLKYRVVFKVYDDLHAVGVIGIGHHDAKPDVDIYRRLEALAGQGLLAKTLLSALKGFTIPISSSKI